MTTYIKHITAICLCIAAVGCTTDEALLARIDEAERISDSLPSEAVAIMRSIDRDDIYGEADNARYALVYSEALYHNGTPVDCDSLTQPMMMYYLDDDNHDERVRALYQHALVAYAAGRNAEAMYALIEAERSFDKCHNLRCKGLIHRTKGEIYNEEWLFDNALESFTAAKECFDKANLPEYSVYAIYDIATIYKTTLEYQRAEQLLGDVLEYCNNNDDPNLSALTMHLLCDIYIYTNRIDKCNECIKEIERIGNFDFYEAHYYLAKAIYAAHSQNRADAEAYLAKAEQLPNDKNDDIELIKSNVYELLGDTQTAFYWYKQSKHIQDKSVLDALSFNILNSQIGQIKSKAIIAEQRAKNQKLRLIIYITIGVIILTSIIIYIGIRLRRRNREIEQYIDIIRELQLTARNKPTDLTEQVQYLYKERFDEINALYDAYYDHKDTSHHKAIIYNQLQNIINSLKDDKARIVKLEEVVNKNYNNVMSILLEEFPKLTERQHRLALYLYAGFSLRAIALFLDSTPELISKSKHKLKEKIAKSNSPRTELLLRHL